MNEFTKEELRYLKYCARYLYADFKSHLKKEDEIPEGLINQLVLIDKLQSLIDNYCDHKNTRQISDADYVDVCRDCGEVLDWN